MCRGCVAATGLMPIIFGPMMCHYNENFLISLCPLPSSLCPNLYLETMPKRKRTCDDLSRVPTCATLSEFMTELVSETLRAHRPCILQGKTHTHRAMITTRYVALKITPNGPDIRPRTKLRSSYNESVKLLATNCSSEPDKSHRSSYSELAKSAAMGSPPELEQLHHAEFAHAALTLALAITNTRE